jgi:hypothetical protein
MYFEDPDVTCLYNVDGAILTLSPLVINKDRKEEEINQIVNSLEFSLGEQNWTTDEIKYGGLVYKKEGGKIKVSFGSETPKVSEILRCRININAYTSNLDPLHIIYEVPIAIGLKIFESDDTGF